MRRRRSILAIVAAGALVTGLAACGGGDSDDSGSGDGAKAEFNGGVGKVFNESDAKGGTITYANSGDWDSLDPGDTYYAYSWNFVRLYGRSLTMMQSAPGKDGATLVPDLAEELGKPSADAKTWTYKLRSGLKFEDGTPITSKDVKYAVERSLDKTTFPNGPTYLNDFLDTQGYTSPYKDTTPDKLGLKAVETPDDQTIIFKLSKPFSGFDYLAMLPATMPVPQKADTGSKYKEHVVSSGPYMFDTNELGKKFTMKRNPNWDPATDPNRKALPDKIEVQLNVNGEDIDNRLLAGDLDVAIEGSGVGPAAQGRILADPALKANADSAEVARLWFTAINSQVAPFDKLECRQAVEYAVDKNGYLRAYGGDLGGKIATNLMPPVVPGSQEFNLYETPNNAGDPVKAKELLAACGQPNGFSTNISYRNERAKEKAVAESIQQALLKIGIKSQLKPYPLADYTKLYAGKPDYAKANGLGIMVYGWGADWPDGFGFLSQIVDSRAIRAAGNTNLGVNDPKVDAAIDKAMTITDKAAREQAWVDVDKATMEGAYYIPGVWANGLLYRPKNLTNVFVTDGFQMYDYLALGTTKK